jgi:hypothetical protein
MSGMFILYSNNRGGVEMRSRQEEKDWKEVKFY